MNEINMNYLHLHLNHAVNLSMLQNCGRNFQLKTTVQMKQIYPPLPINLHCLKEKPMYDDLFEVLR